jgi:hypothetical protein
MYHLLQPGTFTPEFLGTLRVVPDIGGFKFPGDFRQPFTPGIEVKDTP